MLYLKEIDGYFISVDVDHDYVVVFDPYQKAKAAWIINGWFLIVDRTVVEYYKGVLEIEAKKYSMKDLKFEIIQVESGEVQHKLAEYIYVEMEGDTEWE